MNNYPLSNYFNNINKVKTIRYILISILLTTINSLIDFHFTIEKTPIPGLNDSAEKFKSLLIINIILLVASLIKVIFIILFYFAFFYIISKIFKVNFTKKQSYKASILLVFFTYILKTIILTIQYIMNLNTIDYNVGSLNIFDSGNTLLESFNIILILKTYIIFLILNLTIKLSKRTTIILITIYIIIVIGFQIFKFNL